MTAAVPTNATLLGSPSIPNLGVPIYSSLAALALEQSLIPQGLVVATLNPFAFYIAVESPPVVGAYATTSTSSALATPASQVTYWLPISGSGGTAQGAPFTARAASLAIAAYAGSGTGVLTGSATGALAAQDGVTLVAGDQLFLPAGITNVTAVDSGPWVVINPGGTGVKYVLARPVWFSHAGTWVCGQNIKIGGEGTFYKNTSWKVTGTPGAITYSGVIDTVDAGFYVERFTFQRKLVAGTLALAAGQPTLAATSATFPAGIYSASQSNFIVALAIASGTLTTTVSYGMANASAAALATPGYSGTAAAQVWALVAGQTVDNADTSTLNITLINF